MKEIALPLDKVSLSLCWRTIDQVDLAKGCVNVLRLKNAVRKNRIGISINEAASKIL